MRLLFFLIGISALFSCNRDNQPKAFSAEEVEHEVNVMLDNYFRDIARDGLTAEFRYLDQSDQFFWVPPGYASALSYDSVRKILESRAAGYQSINFRWESLKIYPLDNEHASYTGIVKGDMTDTAQVKTDVSLIESGVVIRREEGWKLLCGQSAVLPE